ncbi:MAG TPA: hypothetical protein VK973_05720 [Arenicellales bacterium]|nr:hypothetical protein [Arenicellales bacterium]
MRIHINAVLEWLNADTRVRVDESLAGPPLGDIDVDDLLDGIGDCFFRNAESM